MARYQFPIDRTALILQGPFEPALTPPATGIQLFADAAATVLADVRTLVGMPIANSTVYTVDGLIPEFLGPDGAVRVYGRTVGSTVQPIPMYAQLVSEGGSGTASQLQQTAVASGSISGHFVVTPQPDGTVAYASADNPAHINVPLWVTINAAAGGDTVQAVSAGPVYEPSWSWTPGPVYLGSNGVLTQTLPSAPGAEFLARIGIATAATSLFVERAPSIQLN